MRAGSRRYPAEEVNRAALKYFTEEDIAEAFAATHSVTMPGELCAFLKTAEEDLIAVHRSLVPEHKMIHVQRWTRRRLAALGGFVVVGAVGLWLVLQNISLARQLL